jgi:hypothetical protein
MSTEPTEGVDGTTSGNDGDGGEEQPNWLTAGVASSLILPSGATVARRSTKLSPCPLRGGQALTKLS